MALVSLDRSLFTKTLKLLALKVPTKSCNVFVKNLAMNDLTFCHAKIKSVVVPEDSQMRIILLSPKITSQEELPESIKSELKEVNAEVINHDVKLGYEHFTMEQVLKTLLPESVLAPAGFETIGHIAHLNLLESQLPYKSIIGQVLLDKTNNIQTVVNKTSFISNQFRVFPMELIAGKEDYFTTVTSMNCNFSFDFSQVYWNSRLETEHARMVDLFKSNEVIADMMAGIGPFALPAAKKGCSVYANDLNPKSFEYLVGNIAKNKSVIPFNMDGRAFWKHMRSDLKNKYVSHVLMNLPASAPTFIDCFCGSYSSEEVNDMKQKNISLPMIHCYSFVSPNKTADMLRDKIFRVLGCTPEEYSCHMVRLVSKYVSMQCFSFRLPEFSAITPASYIYEDQWKEVDEKEEQDDAIPTEINKKQIGIKRKSVE